MMEPMKFWILFLFLACCCVLPNCIEQSPYLPTYDIWNDGAKITRAKSKDKNHPIRKIEERIPVKSHVEPLHNNSTLVDRKGKSILNFFFTTDEEECLAEDGRRSGVCLNTYTCRRRDGTSSGFCAHGFGVCCVFVVSCGQEIKNNITYFVSPKFPSLARSLDTCNVVIKKMEGASQLKLDFVHFNLGQPNRLTGDCDSDVFIMSGGNKNDFKLCGQNSDQHIYYDIDKAVNMVLVTMNLSRPNLSRLWEIKVTQIPFGQRAPAGCLQYYTENTGFIQTLNYAENGRHLADQDYNACVRQTKGMCAIAYEPCEPNSFRIGRNAALNTRPGESGGAGSENPGNLGQGPNGSPTNQMDPANPANPQNPADPMDPNDIVGSGDGPAPEISSNSLFFGRQFNRYSPYAQYLGDKKSDGNEFWRYWAYGNYGFGVSTFGRQQCQDRIITPCDSDEFLGVNPYTSGICDPFHCGSTFCPELSASQPCRVETSVTPFSLGIKFGPPVSKDNPEDNIGACLRYEQMPCTE